MTPAIRRSLDARRLGPAGPHVLEVEIVGRGDVYQFRLLPGYRTHNLGLGDPRTALPRELWLSDDSNFVELVTTASRFGGRRYWFKCPRSACGRRCAVLYREPATNARAFACRCCTPFRYESQVLGRSDLMLERIVRRLMRLDFLDDGTFARPKGMHHRTFDRIRREVEPALGPWVCADPGLGRIASHLEVVHTAVERELGVRIDRGRPAPSFRWRA